MILFSVDPPKSPNWIGKNAKKYPVCGSTAASFFIAGGCYSGDGVAAPCNRTLRISEIPK